MGDLFSNQILQLLHNFPEDQVTSSGAKFWSGSKRCPKPLQFDLTAMCEDAEMRNHFDFIVAASNLRAGMYGIEGRTDETYFVQVLKNVMVPDFVPKDGVKIAANEAEAEKENSNGHMDEDVDAEANAILEALPKPSELAGFQLHPIEFDKDIDDHMLFVTACSNLRALNYQIPTEDTHRSRAIAGKIIPDIDKGYTTLGELMEHFEKEYNLEIQMMSQGVSILYSFFANKKKVEERKKMPMSKIIESITKKEFPPNQLFIILELIANDLDTDEEVEIPYVKFRFR